MKKTITNETRAKICLAFWRQTFIYRGSLGIIRTIEGITKGWNIIDYNDETFKVEGCSILLTPLHKITDEDCINIFLLRHKLDKTKFEFNIVKYNDSIVILCIGVNKSEHYNYIFNFKNMSISEGQYLQSKGYATNFTVIQDSEVITYTVDELVEANVFKYK